MPLDASRSPRAVPPGHPAFAHWLAVIPPCAPSTMVSRGSRDPSLSAIGLNALNSWVVLDMPTETKAYGPEALGRPSASSGPLSRAIRTPADRWTAGGCAGGRARGPTAGAGLRRSDIAG